ncbi:hypothetical protein MNEG_6495 [Monoraphidium neglectum]|uniref:SET domain-containing protein n=1 Tax=Monoraphidium neglectum TaxID=145388 RepID=A0A0D2ME65_9CHLO|nr:hypothetical protein MNEG_6495 [Monoraphidium neglectum]KIZ01465.1 hypothetical protein MNEG_6495 [Monoraphidium neglectum]|eukprot:XP_013900484.1 hypothetical protein MNEG_6495 [Monoraphidium neglectum]
MHSALSSAAGTHAATAARRLPSGTARTAYVPVLARSSGGGRTASRGRGASGRGGPARGGRGGRGGRSGRGGRGGPWQQRRRDGGGGAPSGGGAGGIGGGDIVVIGKAESRYIPEDDETLAASEGGSFWETAWRAEFGDDDEDEDEEEGEEGQDGEEGEDDGDDDEENFAAVLQALVPELAEEGETEAQAEWRHVYTSQRLPAPRLGPVTAKRVAGAGRGLVTAAAVEEGELLMVAAPLGILYCPEGATPENEELADHLAQNCTLTAAQSEALRLLAPAGGGAAPAAVLPAREQLEAAAAALAGAGGDTPQAPIDLPLGALYAVVNANCTGEEFEDPVLCALRGSASCGHLGLWPAAALANHSCCPNAVGYAIGDRWVLRAAEPLVQGAEVTVSYLGSLITAPYEERQAELQEKYGFACGCPRCKAEQRAGGALLQLQAAIYKECEDEVGPALEAAVEDGDADGAAAALARLRELRGQYESEIKAVKASAKARRWMQGPETEALAECARIAAAVVKGSDSHLELAAEYMVRAEAKFGPDHQESADAARACRAAHRARYGGPACLGPRLLELLIDTRAALGIEEGPGAGA